MKRSMAVALMALVAVGGVAADTTTKLVFRVFEPFTPTYYNRVLVSPDFMRMDEGPTALQYILMDRRKGTIYTVDDEERTVMVIERRPVTVAPPAGVKMEERAYRGSYYRVAGRKAELKRYTVNGETCMQVAVAPELLPDALAALREYRETLAGEHARVLDRTPGELRDACDMALNIFYPNRYLEAGFPLEESDGRGYRRFLVDFVENSSLGEGWARLPQDYRRLSPGGEGQP